MYRPSSFLMLAAISFVGEGLYRFCSTPLSDGVY